MSQTINEIRGKSVRTGELRRTIDGAAMADMVRMYGGMVYGTCLRVTGDAHLAADATQETFFQLMKTAVRIDESVAGVAA